MHSAGHGIGVSHPMQGCRGQAMLGTGIGEPTGCASIAWASRGMGNDCHRSPMAAPLCGHALGGAWRRHVAPHARVPRVSNAWHGHWQAMALCRSARTSMGRTAIAAPWQPHCAGMHSKEHHVGMSHPMQGCRGHARGKGPVGGTIARACPCTAMVVAHAPTLECHGQAVHGNAQRAPRHAQAWAAAAMARPWHGDPRARPWQRLPCPR